MKSRMDFTTATEYSEYLLKYFTAAAMQGLLASGYFDVKNDEFDTLKLARLAKKIATAQLDKLP